MKNLSDFKKRLQVGTHVHIENHTQPHMTRDTTISRVQSNCFAAYYKEEESYMDYPKSADISFPNPDTAVINGRVTITFKN